MRTVYIVFDKIPQKKDGGLIATYVNFVRELSNQYEIKFISIFKSPTIDIEDLKSIPVITLFNVDIDNRFYKLTKYAKTGNIRGFFKCIYSMFLFFSLIPFGRIKTRKILQNQIVIAPAPASGIYLSKSVNYLLEIHINFEYFWGTNVIGRLQSTLMTKPLITVFRNQSDAQKGSRKFPSNYLYNTCEEPINVESINSAQKARHGTKALFVGRLVDQKNPLALLEIASNVKDKIEDFQLDIYGDGELKTELASAIKRKHLSDFVHLKGFNEDKSVYKNYDLLWVTSKYEGFGLVIIEAAANYVPTITTNWGPAVFEVVDNKNSGYICDTNEDFVNRSVELLLNTEKRELFSQNARKLFINKFSNEAHKQKWIELIETYFPKEFSNNTKLVNR